jgi:FAD/FMN-containing dehydrogenase
VSTVPPPQLPVFNLAVQHRPAQVHAVGSPDELPGLVVGAVRDHERVHVVGAGHGWATPIESGVALLTHGLQGVEVDGAARTARVGAGTRWADVLSAAAGHGLAPVCGSAPGVGVVGFLLGGGLSPVGRTVGWGSEHVRSFDLVTGTGQRLVASADSHPDLFWALRGGNVAPGVVTAVELDLLPLTTLYGGGLFFDAEDAAAVLAGYATWAARVPEAVTSSCAVLRLPDLEPVPPPLRGRTVLHVRVAVVGADDPAGYVAPLRALATPIVDTVAEMPYAALGAIHADPVEPMPVLDGGILLSDFDQAAAEALLAVAGPDVPAPFAVVEVRHLGGALGRPPRSGDAVAGRDARFSLFAVSAPVPDLFAEVVPAGAGRLFDALAPWSTGTVQPNFVGALNGADALERAWDEPTRARLQETWRTYDPTGTFTGLGS